MTSSSLGINQTKVKDVAKLGVSQDDLLQIYDTWASSYDKDLVEKLQCSAYSHVANRVCQLYPSDQRDSIRVLDIGAGTGLQGQALRRSGLVHIDALDPCKKMLEQAKQRDVYETYMLEYFTEKPLDISKDTYDVIVGVGMMGHKHAPFSSMNEMVRLTKPGGHVILAIRRWYALNDPDYREMEPTMSRLESEGKWTQLSRDVIPDYYIDSDGLLFVFQVL